MRDRPKKTIKLSRNTKPFKQVVQSQQPSPLSDDSQSAQLWLEAILQKIEELNKLYDLTSNVIDQLDNEAKSRLKRVLNRLSIKNLDSMIKINISQHKNK